MLRNRLLTVSKKWSLKRSKSWSSWKSKLRRGRKKCKRISRRCSRRQEILRLGLKDLRSFRATKSPLVFLSKSKWWKRKEVAVIVLRSRSITQGQFLPQQWESLIYQSKSPRSSAPDSCSQFNLLILASRLKRFYLGRELEFSQRAPVRSGRRTMLPTRVSITSWLNHSWTRSGLSPISWESNSSWRGKPLLLPWKIQELLHWDKSEFCSSLEKN